MRGASPCSAHGVAAAAAYPSAGDRDRLLRRGCAFEQPWPDTWLDSRVVSRRGLLDVEGFSVRARFDPDRITQRTVLAAVGWHGCHFRLEVSDPPSSGFRRSHATHCSVALHRVSLLACWQPGLFNTALHPPREARAPYLFATGFVVDGDRASDHIGAFLGRFGMQPRARRTRQRELPTAEGRR